MPTATIGDLEIDYTDTGGGLPVLLLHAFPLHAGMWEPQISSLGDRYRLIAPDLKGFGGSSAPEDPNEYTMASYAEELAGFLDHLGLDSAVVVGLSMGGYITFELLRRFPGRVQALVLADTRAEADPPEGVEKRTKQQGMVRADGTAGLIDALVGALTSEATRAGKPDVAERLKELMDNPAAGFIGALEAMKKRPDSSDDLAKIDIPTLVIVGEQDGVTPPEAARKLHEHIGGSRLVVIPEAGHLSSIESPDAFNGALAEFLSQLG
jgi:3-oxoadipate enol-lactonase